MGSEVARRRVRMRMGLVGLELVGGSGSGVWGE